MLYLLFFEVKRERGEKKGRNDQWAFSQGRHVVLIP
jgi:hypothetical protein